MNTAKSGIIGILGSLFVVLSIGLTISVTAQDDSKGKEIGRDDQYIAYSSGVVLDTKTGLEWVAGPDKDTDWDQDKRWVDDLSVAGSGWRMPTIKELKSLYQKGKGKRNMTPFLKTYGSSLWSGEIKDSSFRWAFSFAIGYEFWRGRSGHHELRVFAVRSRK